MSERVEPIFSPRVYAANATLHSKDAQPLALGYVADTNKADGKKFPKHAATQRCGNCALYTGKPDAPSGPCGIFPGKTVAAGGWCSAYAKKA